VGLEGEEKMMKLFDKIVSKNWFMKVLALIFALLLFSYATHSNDNSNEVNVPSDSETVVLENVPVTAYYDTDNVVVTGIPKTVTVTLRGPTVPLQQAKLTKDFEVYVNLANADLGSKTVKIEIKDLSDKLTAIIDPETIKVNVKEKVTEEFKVEAEFSNNSIKNGYSAGVAKVSPSTVKITGAKDEIDKIAYVKANVNLNEATNEDISERATVTVLDSSLNKLDVQVEPETVEVNIPVSRTSKTVPIKVIEKGTPKENIKIDSITLDKKESTITGPEDILKDVESTRVEVDVSTIEKDETLSLPVIISNGISSVEPELVNVTVKVTVTKNETSNSNDKKTDDQNSEETAASDRVDTKTISNVPISLRGLKKNQDVSLTRPKSSRTSLEISGEPSRIAEVNAKDFSLYIDLTGLDDGEHEVPIMVNGPDDIDWELAVETASISITTEEA